MRRILLGSIALGVMAFAALSVSAQSLRGQADSKSTMAYEVLALKRAAVTAELAVSQQSFTRDHPEVLRLADELSEISTEIDRLSLFDASQTTKLTEVYGHLVLRKVALTVEANELSRRYTSNHPSLRKTQAELSALQREIEALLR